MPDRTPQARIAVALTLPSAGALRALLRTEIDRVEQWIRVHRNSASKGALQTSSAFLQQLRDLRQEVEFGVETSLAQASTASRGSRAASVTAAHDRAEAAS